MKHPDQIDGILYRSRHDPDRLNVALFGRTSFLPGILDEDLAPVETRAWKRGPKHGTSVVYGPSVVLRDHPSLNQTLVELQVARLP